MSSDRLGDTIGLDRIAAAGEGGVFDLMPTETEPAGNGGVRGKDDQIHVIELLVRKSDEAFVLTAVMPPQPALVRKDQSVLTIVLLPSSK